MNISSILSRLASLVVYLAVPAVWADNVYMWAEESGSGVTFYFDGSIDLTDFPAVSSTSTNPLIGASVGIFISGDYSGGSVPVDRYSVMPDDTAKAFGTGGLFVPVPGSGDAFGFSGDGLFLPSGYGSGAPFSGSMSFPGATFNSLGVDPTPKDFDSTVGTNTIFLFTISPAELAARVAAAGATASTKADLLRQIKKLKKKSKKLKKKGKTAKAKKLGKKAKKLQAQLAALG